MPKDDADSLKKFLKSISGLEPAKDLRTINYFDMLSCPFCGASGDALSVDGDIMCVLCNACGAEGPYRTDGKDSIEYAIELWNRRVKNEKNKGNKLAQYPD